MRNEEYGEIKMKKTTWLILAIIFTLAVSCSLFDSLFGTDDPGENQEKPVNYAAEFRGEWIRMDTGDRWYISRSSISVNGADSFPRVTLEKKSENVAVATGANNEKYTLKTGGTIYGYASGDTKSNTAKNSSGDVQSNRGHAVSVYKSETTTYRRETTTGPTVNLNSSVAGAAGGWE